MLCHFTLLFITSTLLFPLNLVAATESSRPPIEVFVESVRQQAASDRVEALGTLLANESVALSASVSETITAIHFQDGQRVKEGDLLVELSSAEEQALLAEIQHTLDQAAVQLRRVRTLADKGDASQSLLDESQRDFNVAKAKLAAIESRLKDRQVIAPFDGRIGLRNISVGAFVSPGDVLATLIDDSTMKVDFAVPSLFLNQLSEGAPVMASSRAFPERSFKGQVTAIDNRVDPASRSVKVRAELPNPQLQLVPGLLLEVNLLTRERKALVISESALVPQGDKQFVYVVSGEEGHWVARQQQVIIGSRWPGIVEVTGGLSNGDRIVTHGADKLSPSQRIIIKQDAVREDLVSQTEIQ